MKAHKVPATYFSGWKAVGYNESFYTFYKNNLYDKGILKSFGDVRKITTEHSYFMAENFYYIDFNIKGIVFKLKDEIEDFLNESPYTIECVDHLKDISKDEPLPIVIIDNHKKFTSYMDNIGSWVIRDKQNKIISLNTFNDRLNDYIFDSVGKIIEEDYFAYHLETMWGGVRASIISDTDGLNHGDEVTLTRKQDLLEFFVVQYLRLDKRIKTDIDPKLKIFEEAFIEMGIDKKTLSAMKNDGILTSDAYFYGVLLDAARGDKYVINNEISKIDTNFVIDVLKAEPGYSFLSSTSPCIIIDDKTEEMLFPLNSQYCLFFRKKKDGLICGQYKLQKDTNVKKINNIIVKNSEDIVVSELEYINGIV